MSAGFGVDQKIDTDNRYIEQAGYFLRFTDEISALGFRTFDDGSPRMIIRCQTYLDNLALARHTVVIQTKRRQVAPRFGIQRDLVTGIGMAGPYIFFVKSGNGSN